MNEWTTSALKWIFREFWIWARDEKFKNQNIELTGSTFIKSIKTFWWVYISINENHCKWCYCLMPNTSWIQNTKLENVFITHFFSNDASSLIHIVFFVQKATFDSWVMDAKISHAYHSAFFCYFIQMVFSSLLLMWSSWFFRTGIYVYMYYIFF